MIAQEDQKAPKIFISYSHDTPAHKKWVAELASKLVKNGIDVILDQWDLTLGDDIPKFMENGVGISDRVLMICTEPYVRKADEGEGGVGYEAMIVTGELVRNLGTSKFIPVIQQTSGNTLLPKSLSTRFYVNLSEGQAIEEQFDLLLRELHKVPVLRKPPLGKNPFAQQPSGAEIPAITSEVESIPDVTKILDNIPSLYRTALEVARQGDLVAWRRIVRQANSPIPEQLKAWRQKFDPNPPRDKKELPIIALEGANIYAPIFSIALAGVESGREKFFDQVGLIDVILNPRNWNWSGFTIITNLPETIAYIYQALNGAICLQTHQLTQATKFARTKFMRRFEGKSLPLYQRHEVIGWPETLGGNCTHAWTFLCYLPEKWEWLKELFGSLEEYQESLCAYYMSLNIIEFTDTIAENREEILNQQTVSLDVPLCFLQENEEILGRAYRLLLTQSMQVKAIWQGRNITDQKVKELWPLWMKHLKYWLGRVRPFAFRFNVIHETLFEDLE